MREAFRRACILVSVLYAVLTAFVLLLSRADGGSTWLFVLIAAAVGYAILAGIGWVISALVPRQ